MGLLGHAVILLCALLATGPVGGRIQAAFPLDALTAPQEELPEGCRLDTGPGYVAYPGVRQNPWVGTDAHAKSIRQLVDGFVRRPDGLTEVEAFAKQGDRVVAAYRARYLTPERSAVDVFAVRFNDPNLTAPASLSRLGAQPRHVIILGSTAVVIFPGKGGECFRAIAEHIAAIK